MIVCMNICVAFFNGLLKRDVQRIELCIVRTIRPLSGEITYSSALTYPHTI